MDTKEILALNKDNVFLLDDNTLITYHSLLHTIFPKLEDISVKAKVVGLHSLIMHELESRGLNYEDSFDTLDRVSLAQVIVHSDNNEVWEYVDKNMESKGSLCILSKKIKNSEEDGSISGDTSPAGSGEDHTHKLNFSFKDKKYSVETSEGFPIRNRATGKIDHVHQFEISLGEEEFRSITGTAVSKSEGKHIHAFSFGIPVKKESLDEETTNEKVELDESKISKPGYFKNPSKKAAYFLGFLSTDGHIDDKSYSIELTLKSNDKHILETLKSEIGSENKIAVSGGHARLKFKSKEMVEDLKKMGMSTSKPKSTVYTKISSSLRKDYIRGCMDGDGTLNAKPPKQFQWGSLSKSFADWMFKHLQAIAKADRKVVSERLPSGKSFYKIAYNGEPAAKVAKWVYIGESLALSRKRKEAEKMQ